jgi:putative PIN family toxin of toxin-antitoxin system
VVLDANVLVSGATASAGAIADLMDRWLRADQFDVVLSERILSDVDRVLAEPYFARRLAAQARATYVATIKRAAFVVPIVSGIVGVAPDPDDDDVIAAAMDGQAEYLVTGDVRLRAVGGYAAVQFITPREFIDLLRSMRA